MIEDKLLIWRFKCGSSEALCRIYKKYKNDLLKLASALLNDTYAADDVVQDCFVSFAQSADRIKASGNLKSYLATCVANRARNRLRARKRQETVEPDEAKSAESNLKRPEQWIIYSERLRRLNDALCQLPYEQREAISLHAHAGMRFKAIAQLQDASINTVQSRYRYGLDKLRSILANEAEL